MGEKSANQLPEELTKLLLTVFSWIVLAAIAVIISGKLLAKRVRLGFRSEDRFSINLLVLDLKASGDEVSLGFLTFLISLGLTSIFGGPATHSFFEDRTGLAVGQWNSICFIASLFSLLAAVLIWLVAPIFAPRPLISADERAQQIEKLSSQSSEPGPEA